jgi:hypothetical protein
MSEQIRGEVHHPYPGNLQQAVVHLAQGLRLNAPALRVPPSFRACLFGAGGVQISGSTCLTMEFADCFEESLAEQSQVVSVDRLPSKWRRVFELR